MTNLDTQHDLSLPQAKRSRRVRSDRAAGPSSRIPRQRDMAHRSIAVLAFALFQLVTATLFLRPAEVFSWVGDVPLYEVLILSTLALSVTSMEPHFHWLALVRQPITLCAAALLPAVAISHLQHFYLGGLIDSVPNFCKTLLYFGLVITVVNSPRRLRAFLFNVALCTSTMVALCLFDYWGIWEFEFIEHLHDVDGHDDDGNPIIVPRMRGTGIFQDPNDLAMVIVAGFVLALYFLTDRRLSYFRWLWTASLLVFAAAVLETKSRGGLLAASAAVLMFACFRYGHKFALVLGILAVASLPVLAGRAGNISLSEGSTGHERIEMWREGYAALKSPNLLFGVGHGLYADYAGLVAHNSFVHTYVELGIVGGSLFFGCWYFAAVQLYRMGQLTEPVWHPELARLRPFIGALLAGWCTSMMSLSRPYVVPTFLVLGVAAAYLNLVWIHTPQGQPLVLWGRKQFWRLAGASAATFVGFYLFTIIAA